MKPTQRKSVKSPEVESVPAAGTPHFHEFQLVIARKLT
jgi:hypothetical protein